MKEEEIVFLKNKLIEIQKRAFSFQEKCDEEISNKHNIILSMPTGSGKTERFLGWAIHQLLKGNGKIPKIIITAPIKALSNQRFRELYIQGYNVGLETGDVSYNVDDCTFLCCTQEIATNKYINDKVIAIIDEFHYIYNDSERARAYIDYIIQSQTNYLFLCSATFGDVEKIKKYLERISHKKFFAYESYERLTDIVIKNAIKLENIKNAYVVSFSREKCVKNAQQLRLFRKNNSLIDEKKQQIILKTVSKYEIEDTFLILNALYGVAYYFGSMLPKERLFVLELFQNHLIDTVFGTDAISLGVNFPIENIVFTTLRKGNLLINRNMFNQICGRAGRYGLYDVGYVYYSNDFQQDSHLKDDFKKIVSRKNEDVNVTLMPSIKSILSGKKTIEEELRYVQEHSTDNLNINELKKYIEDAISIIKNFNIEESLAQSFFNHVSEPCDYQKINWNQLPYEKAMEFINYYGDLNNHLKEFWEKITELYDDELLPIQNCILLRDVICGFDLDTILKDSTGCIDGDYKKNFRLLLQVRKYLNRLPEIYKKKIDLERLDRIISKIDASVFDVKLAFQEYSNYDAYQLSLDNKPSLIQTKQSINEKKEVKTSEINSYKKMFKEGAIIKEYDAAFNAPMYLVLLYDKEKCLLLNYSLYQCGFISIVMKSSLKKYYQMDKVTKEQYKEILLKCHTDSNDFVSLKDDSEKKLSKVNI